MKKTIFLSIFALTIVSLVTGCSDSKKASYQFLPDELLLKQLTRKGNSLTPYYLSEKESLKKLYDKWYKNSFTTKGGILYQWDEPEKNENGHYDVSNLKKYKFKNLWRSITRNPFGIEVKDYIPFNDINAVRHEDIDYRDRAIRNGKLVEVDVWGGNKIFKDRFGLTIFSLADEIKKAEGSEWNMKRTETEYVWEAYRILAKAGYIRLKDAYDIKKGLILVRPLSIAEILGFDWSEVSWPDDLHERTLSSALENLQNKIVRDKKQAEDLKIKPRTAFTEYELRCIGFGFKNEDIDACVKQEKFYDKRIKDQEVILSYKLKQQETNYQRKLDQLDDDTSVDWWSMRESDEKYRLNRKIYNLEKKLDRQTFLNNRELRRERQRQNKDEYKKLEPIKYNNYNDE